MKPRILLVLLAGLLLAVLGVALVRVRQPIRRAVTPQPTQSVSTRDEHLPPAVDSSVAGETLPPRVILAPGESQGAAIQQAMRDDRFAALYAGLYFEHNRHVVLVTERPWDVQAFLIAQGIPAAVFQIRLVDDSLHELQQASRASEAWLGRFPGNGAVAVDEDDNIVRIVVESQPLRELLGYDPGNEPVPYVHWPGELKAALLGIVPGVDVDLRGGFAGPLPVAPSDSIRPMYP